ncbi:hypothetical protein GCM10011494_00710 [Novosphingobium endophyticum]|uniref:DUF5801 domain-containing protein n=1 Tax=Novosphingobium endophyticum TaxID=1955250 RepID=A0A916X3T2_9SPHN|nr:DUF5801 repeats-in-toxin domain-containing protein [Novosphingobium endophyticum]GGB86266.1 hypothetical protein GCM10011494_00710 [Novosphingobium endophyticum]
MDFQDVRGSQGDAPETNLTDDNAAAAVAAQGQGLVLLPNADNVVILPEGATLDDLSVRGRDILVTMPDGRVFVIPDGAVYVPQIVIGDVAVPPLNLAALLTGSEPQPAAGPVQSSGGNFSDPTGRIQAAYGLGDLLPYTELSFAAQQDEEVLPQLVEDEPEDNQPAVLIQVDGETPGVQDAIDSVDEAGLEADRPNGNQESPGSAAGNGSDGTTGTILVTSLDGVASITINGVVVTGAEGQQVQGSAGVLTLGALNGGQIAYTYTLSDNTAGDASTDEFTVVITDNDGDTATATLTLDIADDVPTARADSDTVPAGDFAAQSGNVLTGEGTTSGAAGVDTQGADGASITGIHAGTSGEFSGTDSAVAGQYGMLTVSADGSYSYVRTPGTPGAVTDVFTYRLADGDGDVSTATLTISVDNSAPAIVSVPEVGDGTEVNENRLPSTTDTRSDEAPGSQFVSGSESTTGTITFHSVDGVASVSLGGTVITPGGLPQVVSSDATGTLTVTGYVYDPATGDGSITYVYTLNDNTANTDDSTVSFEVIVVDADGDEASDTLDIQIIDDVPDAVDDTAVSVAEDASGTVGGNVLANDTLGADGASVTSVTIGGTSYAVAASGTTSVSTASGAYTFDAAGNWTFDPASGLDHVGGVVDASFTYTLTDGDGDTDTAVQPISITDGAGPSADEPVSLTVDDENLAEGSNPATPVTASDAIVFTAGSDAIATIAFGTDLSGLDPSLTWARVDDGTITGSDGGTLIVTLALTRSGDTATVTATLSGNYDAHPTIDVDDFQALGSVDVVATDSDGDTATSSVSVSVSDDVPEAAGESVSQATENVAFTIDALANDTFGADGVDTTDATKVFVSSQASQGTVTYDASTGLFTYTPAPGAGSTSTADSFEYTIVDGDGDTSSAIVNVTLQPDSEPEGGERVATVDDDGLPSGNAASVTGDIDANVDDDALDISEASFTGTVAFDVGNDTPATVTFAASRDGSTGMVGSETVTYAVSGSTLTATVTGGARDGTALFQIEILDSQTGQYKVTLLTNVLHEGGPNDEGQNAFASIDFTVADSNGDTATTNLAIVFNDDAPTAYDDTNAVEEGGSIGGNVLSDGTADAFGADGPGGIVSFAQGEQTKGPGETIESALGFLTVNADGSYSYQSKPNSTAGDTQDSFTYTIVDADGDTSTATLTIDITASSGNVSDSDVIVDESGLASGSQIVPDGEFDTDGQITVSGGTPPYSYVLTSPSDGTYGTLALNAATGEYSYTLDTPFTDSVSENSRNVVNGAESFGYEVYDDLGNLIGSGSISVSIVDDVPTAADDAAVNVAEDAVGTVGGNVLANDTPGADGAMLTSVNIGGVEHAIAASGTTTIPLANGTYTFQANGAWTFDPNPGLDQSAGPVDASFTYTLTDGDGDFDQAAQPIFVTDGAGPTVGPDIALRVDDENLADGSDPAAPVQSSGDIVFTPGSDPITSIVFGDISNLGGGLTWVRVDDDTITGSDGGRLVITLELTTLGKTATVTATLNDEYNDHPIIDADDLADLGTVEVIASDGETGGEQDSVSATVSVSISDDLPTLSTSAPSAGALTVDESDFAVDATADFSGLFTPDYNADNPGTVGSYTLGINAGATGLVDTLSGEDVVLVMNGGVVEGRTETGNDLVFSVSVDGGGTVTLNQERAVVHADGANPNDPANLAATNLITLTATATDSDGDTASATANIGGAFTFLDDGPSIDATVTDGDTVMLVTQDADTIGASTDSATSTANFGGAFTVASSSHGADGAGSIVWEYALEIENSVSNLSHEGAAINLYLIAGKVVGSTAGDAASVNAGNTVFDIAVSGATGVVTLNQYQEIDHALPGDNAAPYDGQLATLAENLVNLVGKATITDGDGDEASDTVSLDLGGNIGFADDGPSVSGAELGSSVSVDETVAGDPAGFPISNTSAAPMLIFTSEYGADDGGTTTYAIAIVGDGTTSLQTAQGDMGITLLQTSGTVITGVYDTDDKTAFTVTINADGTVTLVQNVPLEHLTDGPVDPDDYNDALDLSGLIEATVTVTDDDGDSASDSAQIGGAITFHDDGPSAANDTDAVTEDGPLVANGNVITGAGSDGDPGGADSFGGDGAGAVTAVTGNAAGTVGGNTGGSYGTLVLNANGGYSYTLDNANAAVQALASGETLTDTFTYTITDADGDADTATLTVTINGANDAPVVTGSTVAVSEEGLPGGIADDAPLSPTDADTTDSATASGSITISDADANDTLTVTLGTPVATLYAPDGVTALTWDLSPDGQTLKGYSANINDPEILVTIDDNGNYTVTLGGPILHTDTGIEDLTSFVVPVAVSDGTTTTNSGITVTVEDDMPVAANDANTLDEDTASVGGNVLANDAFGADGSHATQQISVVSGTAAGTIGGATAGAYGTLQLNLDGSYTYEPDTAAVQGLDDGEQVTDTFSYTIKDADGDTSTAQLTVTVTGANDAPVVTGSAVAVSEEGLNFGNPDDDPVSPDDADTTDSATASGSITITDADAGDTHTVALGAPSETLYTPDGVTPLTWHVSGDGHTLTGYSTDFNFPEVVVTIDDNGNFTVTLGGPVLHADMTTEDLTSFVVPVTVGDGTTTTNSAITVTIEDDSPIAVPDSETVLEGNVTFGDVLLGSKVGGDSTAAATHGTITGVVSQNLGTSDTMADGSGDFVLAGEFGTLTLNRDGGYTYQSTANGLTASDQDVFEFTMVDADGDPATSTLTIDVLDVTLVADNQTRQVDEAALDTTTSGDDLGNGTVTGSNPGSAAETVTGTLNAMGPTGAVTYVPQSVTTAYGIFDLNSDGTYTYTLTNPYTTSPDSNDGAVVEPAVETFTYTAQDVFGNSVTGTVTIDIKDDVPTATTPASIAVTNTAGGSNTAYLDADLSVANNYGADGAGAVIFTTASIASLESQSLTSGLVSLEYAISADGTVLTASKSSDSSLVFTIELQPGGSADQYVVTMAQKVDATSTIDFDGGGYSPVGGNASWFGFVQPGDNNSQDLLLTPVGGGTVNTSANAFGVAGGQSIGSGEALRVDFVIDLTGTPVNGGNFQQPSGQTQNFDGHYVANGSSAFFTNINNSSTVNISAYDDADSGTIKNVGDGVQDTITGVVIAYNGSELLVTTNGSYSVGGHSFGVTFNATGSVNVSGIVEDTRISALTADGYNSIQWKHDGGDTFKIGDFGATTVTNESVDFTVPVSIQDGDGDTVSSGSLNITLDPVAPPIALDLDGDGVEFLGLNAGVAYDYGSGLVQTAWVAGDDGLLARDTGSGLDIVFTDDAPGAKTDLEGLRLAYDSNGDGQFTAADGAFRDFGVWQDANSNALVDEGEYQSLLKMGITSIDLISDGVASSEAGGDVTVHGTGQYSMKGTTFALADVSLKVGERVEARTAEIAAVSLAAAGFMATQGVHAEPLLPIAAEAVAGVLQTFQMDTPELRVALPDPADGTPPVSLIEDHAPQDQQAETSSHHAVDAGGESAQHGLSEVVQPQDFALQPLADADEGHALFGTTAISFGGVEGGLMQALLLAVQVKQAGNAEQQSVDFPAVQEALAQGGDQSAVDALIEHFAGQDGAQDATSAPQASEHALDAMLAGAGMEGFYAAGAADGFDMAALAATIEAHSVHA